MSSFDAYCSKCGRDLESWLTASGDNLVVEPCKNNCGKSLDNKFETDEDFEEENDRL